MPKQSNHGEVLSGLYVSVPLQPSEELGNFLDTLPHSSGRALATNRLHATLMYGGDCPYPVTNASQHDKLISTKEMLAQELGSRSFDDIGLVFDPVLLQQFCGSVGLGIKPDSGLQQVRRDCVDIVQDGLGIKLDASEVPLHASLIKPRRGQSEPVSCYLSQAEMTVDESREPEVSVVATSFADAAWLKQLRSNAF